MDLSEKTIIAMLVDVAGKIEHHAKELRDTNQALSKSSAKLFLFQICGINADGSGQTGTADPAGNGNGRRRINMVVCLPGMSWGNR